MARLSYPSGGFAVRRGNRTVAIGDSITNGSGSTDNTDAHLGYQSWFTYACFRSGQRIKHRRNAGIGGNTTTQMLARFGTDVLAYAPDVCVIFGGTNDIGTGLTAQQVLANLTAMVALCRQNNIRPVMCLLTPRSDLTGANATMLLTLNTLILDYATRNAIDLLDFYTLMVDASTNGLQAAYALNAIHPNSAGAQVMGQYASDTLAALLPPSSLDLTAQVSDPVSLVANGVFIGDANADGVADSWTTSGTTGTVAYSLVADTSAKGNWQQLQLTAAGSRSLVGALAGWHVGDTLAFSGRFTTQNIQAGGMVVTIRVLFAGGVGPFNIGPVYNIDRDQTNSAFYMEGVVPAGTTAANVIIGASTGTGTLQVSQVTVRNLTTLGVA